MFRPVVRRFQRAPAAALVVLLAFGCGDVQGPGEDITEAPGSPEGRLPALLVSNPPGSPGSPGSTKNAVSLDGSVSADLVYVSMAPGSVPNGERIVIRTRGTGGETAAVLIEGGLDPIPVAATVGDTLDVLLYLAGIREADENIVVVPERRPPVLVRSDPLPGRRDVPLNAVLLLVFSEPMDAATLTASSLNLSREGSPVAARLDFGDPAGLTVTITPDEPLAAGAEYTLTATRALEDRDGDALAAPATVVFATLPPFELRGRIAFVSTRDGDHETDPAIHCPADASWCITPEAAPATDCSAQSDRRCIPPASIYVIDADGVGLQRLTTSLGDAAPAWSADGRQIAFAGYEEGVRSIYVTSADGSNATRRADGLLTDYNPEVTWSPDGSAIAFRAWRVTAGGSAYGAIATVGNADGAITFLPLLYAGNLHPSWSPDGQRIAVVADSGGYLNIHVMNADGSSGHQPLTHDYSPADFSINLHPAWSPDGTMIAYVRGTVVDESFYRFQVAVASASGALIKYLAPAGDFAPYVNQYENLDPGSLAWSPDGRAIAYTHCDSDLPLGRPCSETRSIRYVTLDGAQQGTIVSDAHSPSWRP